MAQMARKLRVEYAGACYRGNYRRSLCEEKGVTDALRRCLLESGARFVLEVHAFVVMRSHYHLAGGRASRDFKGALSRVMT